MQTHIFNSQIPVSFREDGYLNATAIAAHFGKVSKDYLKTEQTQEYITALAEFLSKGRKIPLEQNQIVIVKKGGNDSGTWLHPKLAVHFARWLDAKFAVWCDMKIEEIISGSLKITPEQKQQIRQAVQLRHHRTGEHWQAIYEKLHTFCQVNSYHEIAADQFQAAMQFLASIENAPVFRQPESGIVISEEQIYQLSVLTRYAQAMGDFLERISDPLRLLGSSQSGRAYSLGVEPHPWICDMRQFVRQALPQMRQPKYIDRVKDSLARMN